MRKVSMYCLLLLAFGAQACLNDENPNKELEEALEKQDVQISRHLADNNIDATKDPLGAYVLPLTENSSGTVIEDGDLAEVSYRFTQLDGTLIADNEGDSMRVAYDAQGSFVPFYLYYSLGHMKEGEKYRFYVPFNYAYGNYQLEDVIPFQGIVVMEMEVKEVYKTAEAIKLADIAKIERVIEARGQEADTLNPSDVRKVLLEEGAGEQVDAKDEVSVYYTGSYLDGEVFDTNTGASQSQAKFVIGNTTVIDGFETALKSMKEGEKAVFYIPSGEAYGKDGRNGGFVAPEAVSENLNVGVPPHSPLVFEIEVVKVTKKD